MVTGGGTSHPIAYDARRAGGGGAHGGGVQLEQLGQVPGVGHCTIGSSNMNFFEVITQIMNKKTQVLPLESCLKQLAAVHML